MTTQRKSFFARTISLNRSRDDIEQALIEFDELMKLSLSKLNKIYDKEVFKQNERKNNK